MCPVLGKSVISSNWDVSSDSLRRTTGQLPNVHPETGIRDKAVPFKVLMKFRTIDPRMKMKACMGVNGVPTGSGVVKVGDRVHVKKLLSV
jgi:hypothetical protein